MTEAPLAYLEEEPPRRDANLSRALADDSTTLARAHANLDDGDLKYPSDLNECRETDSNARDATSPLSSAHLVAFDLVETLTPQTNHTQRPEQSSQSRETKTAKKKKNKQKKSRKGQGPVAADTMALPELQEACGGGEVCRGGWFIGLMHVSVGAHSRSISGSCFHLSLVLLAGSLTWPLVPARTARRHVTAARAGVGVLTSSVTAADRKVRATVYLSLSVCCCLVAASRGFSPGSGD
ncbi:hypothetical protein C0Q70_01252 [Pomacea canaliculata]|uniref:Uncharacterized protein n=1 Tax=Pomacea canaliculata TaxID=400727 RepID=A0A2T7PYX8_POMCA|nr:hypothetical protein C0Q70_01252 [Pomacea canaliculata]